MAVDPSALRAQLDAGLAAMPAEIGHALDQPARDRLIQYLQLLGRWNQAYNLTAIRDPREQVARHMLDSLAVLPWVTRGPVLDLGTGAGLPGIPLATARPDLAFTLLDSNGKKTRFVRQAVLDLGLKNVEVIQIRLEAYRPERKFATIVARALASLPSLRASAQGLSAADGCLLALKGRLAEDELAALIASRSSAESDASLAAEARFGEPRLHPLVVPGVDGERSLIEVPLDGSIHV
ncbi:16S rRNA (guanine(527)-N(7))-methyltransferase RsmG [Lamprobacter modestohalophilus]|uniref:16S rRNA (guanine(527)-N(7))-methyltransferase RsmG n=1 Tax=Lamprobacter modestohalophilus TaxID=1064514 RepID=UPI002ADEF0C5|nr:16S rRNA (guanine(527)-N(7))-methyltransferase RsmG [Lamprobacter modestohalophilus]MEA1050902.1 16S rRNA (guanine(527)-N(7))-methyltransferase RsmG [Lamprobacter modestohalophilus]